MNVDIGKLNKIIIIQKLTNGYDDNEIPFEDWKDYKKVWANVNCLHGKEFELAKATNTENSIDFIIRYNKIFDDMESNTYRILWNEKVFDIKFVDYMGFEKKLIKLKCEVLKKNG